MALICNYFEHQLAAEKQYGQHTVVLMQIGTFYEIYEYDPQYCTSPSAKIDSTGKIWDQHIGYAVEVSRVLNAVLTYQDSNKAYAINNPNKMGFPVIAYEKNRDALLNANYGIVRIDQENKPTSTNKTVNRYIAEVISPTMELATTSASNNIVCIYLEYQQGKTFDNYLLTIGVAFVDTLTGSNSLGECYSKKQDSSYALQEIYRLLLQLSPREVKLYLQDIPIEQQVNYQSYLEQLLQLNKYERYTFAFQEMPKEYVKIDYQKDYLNRLFPSDLTAIKNVLEVRNDNILTQLQLENLTYGRLAYLLLLHFVEKYNPLLLQRLHRPNTQWLDDNKYCILTHNALEQLDILPLKASKGRSIDSLLSVINLTRTACGKRLLIQLLSTPMYRKEEIESYYQRVEELRENNHWKSIDVHLREIPDIERLQRKVEIETINPKELTTFYRSYITFVNMYIDILNLSLHQKLFTTSQSQEFNTCLTHLTSNINWKELECCTIRSGENKVRWLEFTTCPFNVALLSSDLQQCLHQYTQAYDMITNIVQHLGERSGLNISLSDTKRKVGATYQEPSSMFIYCTNSVANKLLSSTSYDVNLCGQLEINSRSASEKVITSNIISRWLEVLNINKNNLRYGLFEVYQNLIKNINSYTFHKDLARILAEVDVSCCYAHVSQKYKYFRPQIIEGEYSKVKAKDVRHPISEIIEEGLYVPNDLEFDASGLLLFGVNQTGKSSLAKALAMNILLAQAGCYTAGQLEYVPYKRIITRLRHGDNLYERKSTFAVEMLELRTILKQADEFTLVIGDELCHGTEIQSGLAITASSIAYLVERRASFIFATHMHDLVELPLIKNIASDKLRIAHLTVSYENDILIYQRKLQDGPGLTFYGLIVAQSLGLPMEVISQAYDILKGSEQIRTSRYNSKVYMDQCAKCNRKDNLQTHHLKEQHEADKDGFIGTMHKNSKNNLIVLCKFCHTELHQKGNDIAVHNTNVGVAISTNAS